MPGEADSTVGGERGVSVASGVTVGLVGVETARPGVGMSLAGVSVGKAVGSGVICGAQAPAKRLIASAIDNCGANFITAIVTQQVSSQWILKRQLIPKLPRAGVLRAGGGNCLE